MADHELRPECAKEFGKISTALEGQKELRSDQKVMMSDLGEIKTMLVAHIALDDGRNARLDSFESGLDKLDGRVYSISAKVAGVVGILIVIAHYVAGKLL